MKDLIKARVSKKINKKVKILYSMLFVLSMIISASITATIMTVFDKQLNVLGNMFVIGISFLFFMFLQVLIPVYLTNYSLKQEIKLLLKEDFSELKPIKFHTNWDTLNFQKYVPSDCITSIDKDTGYIYFCKERMDNYAHYYVIETAYSDEKMFVVQKAYDDTNNIPRILREVKVNKFIHGFKD